MLLVWWCLTFLPFVMTWIPFTARCSIAIYSFSMVTHSRSSSIWACLSKTCPTSTSLCTLLHCFEPHLHSRCPGNGPSKTALFQMAEWLSYLKLCVCVWLLEAHIQVRHFAGDIQTFNWKWQEEKGAQWQSQGCLKIKYFRHLHTKAV